MCIKIIKNTSLYSPQMIDADWAHIQNVDGLKKIRDPSVTSVSF